MSDVHFLGSRCLTCNQFERLGAPCADGARGTFEERSKRTMASSVGNASIGKRRAPRPAPDPARGAMTPLRRHTPGMEGGHLQAERQGLNLAVALQLRAGRAAYSAVCPTTAWTSAAPVALGSG